MSKSKGLLQWLESSFVAIYGDAKATVNIGFVRFANAMEFGQAVAPRSRSLEETSAEETALSHEDIAHLWEDEAQRRLAGFDSGRIGCVPRDEAIRLAAQDLAK